MIDADGNAGPTIERVAGKHAGVQVIRLRRPEKRNALNEESLVALLRILDGLQADPAVRCVVLEAEGPIFCAGADIGGYDDRDAEDLAAFTALANRACAALDELPMPAIAAVQGAALGGGFEIVMACDLVIAASNATFGLPELSLGLIPGWGGTQRLTALLGARRAKHMILTGNRLDARQAYDAGLVAMLCDADELTEQAHAFAGRIAALPRAASAAVLAAVDASTPHERQSAPGFRFEQAQLLHLFGTADGREGIQAFVQKRAPSFL